MDDFMNALTLKPNAKPLYVAGIYAGIAFFIARL